MIDESLNTEKKRVPRDPETPRSHLYRFGKDLFRGRWFFLSDGGAVYVDPDNPRTRGLSLQEVRDLER